MADTIYNRGKFLLASGGITWGTTDMRALLLITDDNGSLPASAWDPTLNTVSELLAASNVSEATGTGYSRLTLSNMTTSEDDVNNWAVFDADDLSWASISAGTVRAVVLFKYNADDSAAELLSLHDSGFPKVTSGSTLTIAWPVTGVITGV